MGRRFSRLDHPPAARTPGLRSLCPGSDPGAQPGAVTLRRRRRRGWAGPGRGAVALDPRLHDRWREMSNPGTRRNGSSIKIRLTVLCAKNLAKKDFFRLPDPFAKIVVDGSGQCHSTDTVKNTLDPKWNQHYDLYVGKTDSITISVWNHKKIHKKQGAGFLGCVRLLSNAISRLKDTGYQRLDLCKLNPSDTDAVRGQIVAPCMKTRGLGGRSAASWRNQPRTQIAPVLLLGVGTAGLGNPQVKIKDFRHSDFEILRSEGHSRHLRTDLMATSHQNCPKAMNKEQQCRGKFTFCTHRLELVRGTTPGYQETLTA